MKNLGTVVVCLITTLMISCQKDEPAVHQQKGKLLLDIGLSVQVNEISNTLKSTLQTEDFKVLVYNAGGSVVMAFESVLVMPDTIELEIGDYYVEAHSDNNLPAAFDNPYYYGISETFSITTETVQTIQVNCTLANTIVSVLYSDNVTLHFSDYRTTVSSFLGSLIFLMDETRMGYFQTLPLEIMVELFYQQPDGSEGTKTIAGSIPDPLSNRHYEIHVDAAPDDGMATFQILLDDTPVLTEVVDLNDGAATPGGTIGYGDLLITEIMYDPSVLSDTEGEWFEIYNQSGETIQLQNLVVTRDAVNNLVISESIELPPGAFFVFQRTAQATDAVNSLVYGSAISLANTGAVLSLCNPDTGSGPGAMIFSVNYGDPGFPNGTGASISLDPDLFNGADAISGTSWCTSTSVYSSGDFGTPGTFNDNCQ
jgi:hypothetical protein